MFNCKGPFIGVITTLLSMIAANHFCNLQEAGANQIEGQTAYMLFYERDGIDMKAYLPKIREPSTSSVESAISDMTTATKSVVECVDDW